MIHKATIGGEHNERKKVLEFLKDKSFSVVDVGGAGGPWADEFATSYVDMNSDWRMPNSKKLIFNANISDEEGWLDVIKHVKENGKFDFAICTQTLEDIRNPPLPLRMLPLIAKEGYIDVPSKYHELTWGCEKPDKDEMKRRGLKSYVMGYSGHRWIMNMIDNVLVLYPKIPLIEHLEGLEWEGTHGSALCFWWKDTIEFEIVGNDFLGPNPPGVSTMYREGLRRGL